MCVRLCLGLTVYYYGLNCITELSGIGGVQNEVMAHPLITTILSTARLQPDYIVYRLFYRSCLNSLWLFHVLTILPYKVKEGNNYKTAVDTAFLKKRMKKKKKNLFIFGIEIYNVNL